MLPNKWKKVRHVLIEMQNTADMWKSLDDLSALTRLSNGERSSILYGLKMYYETRSSNYNKKNFIETLRAIARYALSLETRIQELMLLYSAAEHGPCKSLRINRQLIAELLAHSFLCLTRGRVACTFRRIFANINKKPQMEKVKCILSYFTRLNESGTASSYEKLQGKFVKFDKIVQTDSQLLSWSHLRNSQKKLCKLAFDKKHFIEDVDSKYAKVLFANSNDLAGRVLLAGNSYGQQEIFCTICPELIVSKLFLPNSLKDNEAMVVSSFERFSDYDGCDRSFMFIGRFKDQSPQKNVLIALNTHSYADNRQRQYQRLHMLRDINKAYAGFSQLPLKSQSKVRNNSAPIAIATGNWGCGELGGDVQLKTMLQWVAASEAGCEELLYCTLASQKIEVLNAKIEELSTVYQEVGDIIQMLERCEEQVNGNFLAQQVRQFDSYYYKSGLEMSTRNRYNGCILS